MILKKIVTLLILLLVFTEGFSQNESFKDIIGRFIIKERRLVSKTYADIMNKSNDSLPIGEWTSVATEKIDSTLPPPPPLPNVLAYDFKRYVNFIVKPNYYIQYSVYDNVFDSDELSSGPLRIFKINREDLLVELFSTFNFEKRNGAIYNTKFCDYQIFEEDKSMVRNISGYDCFKVILKNSEKPEHILELYVTEKIKLNYHPIINCESIFKNYFPLYIKEFHKDYPDDFFEEFYFMKK